MNETRQTRIEALSRRAANVDAAWQRKFTSLFYSIAQRRPLCHLKVNYGCARLSFWTCPWVQCWGGKDSPPRGDGSESGYDDEGSDTDRESEEEESEDESDGQSDEAYEEESEEYQDDE